MNNMNRTSTMPEISPEITDERVIEALFAQRPYEEKVINSAFLEIPADYHPGVTSLHSLLPLGTLMVSAAEVTYSSGCKDRR